MNIKKIIGLGLLASLIGCQGAPQAACVHAPPAPAQQPNIFVAVPQSHSVAGSQHPTDASSHGATVSAQHTEQHGAVVSEAGHVHTEGNKAGGHPNGDVAKHRWTSASGEPHQSEESTDKEGNHHQIHRWTDKTGCSHETDHWNDDKTGNTHQCHRWIDHEGTTHEAVHVTKKDGSVASEHFTKDKDGKIKKLEDKHHKKKEEKESDSEEKEKPHPQPLPVVSGGAIVHSPDCAASPKPNLSTHQ